MRKRFNGNSNIILHPYSLVEMLVVIAIIAILVGLGAGGYKVAHKWLAQSSTEALLSKLKIALESYKNDKGYYPRRHTTSKITGLDSVSTSAAPNFRLDGNVKDFADVDPTGYASNLPASPYDYLQPRNNMSSFMDYSKIRQDQSLKVPNSTYNEYYVKDGWNAPVGSAGSPFGPNTPGGPIKYRCPGLINRTSFDLYSAGPDRVFAADPAVDIEDDIYAK